MATCVSMAKHVAKQYLHKNDFQENEKETKYGSLTKVMECIIITDM